jgi:hypothetical protein
MPQNKALRRCGTPSDHMLVTAANIGGYDFEDDPVVAFAVTKGQFGIVDLSYFYFSGFYIGYAVVFTHFFKILVDKLGL